MLVERAESAARVWAAGERAVVLGAGSSSSEEVRLEACRADGVRVARRITGGSAVLLSPGVACVSLVLPHADFPEARKISGAYRIVASLVARALESLGVATVFRPPGDLAVAGRERKVAGLAQARRRRATLVHAAVPVELAIEELERYLPHPPAEPAYREGRPHREFVTTLAAELGRHCSPAEARRGITPGDESRVRRSAAGPPSAGTRGGPGGPERGRTLMADVLAAFGETLSAAGSPLPVSASCRPTEEELAEAARLVAAKYGRDGWTFRR